MPRSKQTACSKTHSTLAPEAQAHLESAFEKVRRWTAQRRVAGGKPISDVDVARFIDESMDSIVSVAAVTARRRERESASESARKTDPKEK